MDDETKFSMALELPTKHFLYLHFCPPSMPTKIIGEVTKECLSSAQL